MSKGVQLENSKLRMRKLNMAIMGAGGGAGVGGDGPGDGGDGPGDGGDGPGDGGDGPGDGGDGPGDGGDGPGDGGDGAGVGDELQSVLDHTQPVVVHNPSADDDEVPVLHCDNEGHQPQLLARVQSIQDESEPQVSDGGEGGGLAPLEKAAQSKTDRTGSVEQTEFAAPQLLLIVLRRVLAVMYDRLPVLAELMTTLQPKDSVAVPPLAPDMVTLTAWKLARAKVESAAENSWYFDCKDQLLLTPAHARPGRKKSECVERG